MLQTIVRAVLVAPVYFVAFVLAFIVGARLIASIRGGGFDEGYYRMTVEYQGVRGLMTIETMTGKGVFVEILPPWEVWMGRKWWWSYLIPAGMGATTCYPDICFRPAQGRTWSLSGIFHELFGHGTDQQAFAARYGERWKWVWDLRYEWRMAWCGFNYHSEIDEHTAVALEQRLIACWNTAGQPEIVRYADAVRWMQATA